MDSLSPASSITDQLGPLHIIEQIVYDWFDLIHSVSPILHRASFLRRLANNEASVDPIFSLLVASVCAATIASLRRKSSAHGYYGIITVEKCIRVAEQNSFGEWSSQKFTLEGCQTKYNMAVALNSEFGMDNPDSFRFMGEAVTGVKYLIYYQLDSMDFISQQLLKRLYWLLFAAQCTMGLHGRPCIGLMSPQDNLESLRPLEITDLELDSLRSRDPETRWHGDRFSYIPGLNFLSRLFLLWYESQQARSRNISHLQGYLLLLHSTLDDLPPELRWRGGLSRTPKSNFGTDVQTANLYITQIHIRSNLLEQMDQLSQNMTEETGLEIRIERQRIVDDMLAIIYQMPEETLEANGYSLVPKIRDIGTSLLTDTGQTDALTNLDRLLSKLSRLDYRPQAQFPFDSTSPVSI